MNLLRPLEPGIVCTDLDRMLHHYTDILGLHIVSDLPTDPELSTRFRATPDGYRIVRLETPEGYRIKLVQPAIPPCRHPHGEWVFQNAGIAYLTFVVTGIDAIVDRLRALGVPVVSESIVEIRPGIRAVYTLDPEGNYLEFIEYV
jgi:catechol 2,3-dioxygenase-like lactoylglutathione lyase family enzyme